MKHYSDLFTATQGVFTVMKQVQPLLYADLFNNTDTAQFDAYAYFKSASRCVLPLLTTDNIEQALNSLFTVRGDNWRKIHTALVTPVAVGKVTTTETLTGSDNNSDTNTGTNTDSEKAFNSVEFVASGKTDNSSDRVTNREYNSHRNITRDVDSVTDSINANVDLQIKRNMLDIVLTDIINHITLNVYE